MATNNKRLTYGICILAGSALLLTWISHSGHKAEPPREAPIPWKGEAPSQATPSTTTQESPPLVAQPDPRPATQSPRPPDDASSASSSLPPTLYAPSHDEEPSPPDSDQSLAQPQETAAQRVARQLRRR
jgi:hypothetical protein